MSPTIRKLIGLVLLLFGLVVYALLMMQLFVGLSPMSKWFELPFFMICGIGWIIWAAPLISWMKRPAK